MADKSPEERRSSPTENYNPLDEDLKFYDAVSAQTSDHDADMSHSDDNTEEPDGDQGANSLEGFLEDICNAEAEEMPFSPPTHSRLAKREKKETIVERNSSLSKILKQV